MPIVDIRLISWLSLNGLDRWGSGGLGGGGSGFLAYNVLDGDFCLRGRLGDAGSCGSWANSGVYIISRFIGGLYCAWIDGASSWLLSGSLLSWNDSPLVLGAWCSAIVVVKALHINILFTSKMDWLGSGMGGALRAELVSSGWVTLCM